MTKTELNKFRNILEAKQAELEQVIRNREAITIEKSPDALDEVQRRIDEGTFGVCLHCEEDISPKRLNAVPWTAFCIQCQEQADRNREMMSDNFDDMLVNAA